jgi:CheY-like chemotaxis protein
MDNHMVVRLPVDRSQKASVNQMQKVLIVDDEAPQRRQIATCLNDLGIETIEAQDGVDALRIIKDIHPAVIIMDVRMPKMDGVAVAEALGKASDTKIVLMTGDPDSLYRANRSGLDIFTVIEKPIPLRVLSRFVLRALGRE